MKFVSVPITTREEYDAMGARGVDFCDGCGGRYRCELLSEAQLETSDGYLAPGQVCSSCAQENEEQMRDETQIVHWIAVARKEHQHDTTESN